MNLSFGDFFFPPPPKRQRTQIFAMAQFLVKIIFSMGISVILNTFLVLVWCSKHQIVSYTTLKLRRTPKIASFLALWASKAKYSQNTRFGVIFSKSFWVPYNVIYAFYEVLRYFEKVFEVPKYSGWHFRTPRTLWETSTKILISLYFPPYWHSTRENTAKSAFWGQSPKVL